MRGSAESRGSIESQSEPSSGGHQIGSSVLFHRTFKTSKLSEEWTFIEGSEDEALGLLGTGFQGTEAKSKAECAEAKAKKHTRLQKTN